MIDACQDGWAGGGGGIPVCVLSGTAAQQHESSNGCAASRAMAVRKERDYMSLGLAGMQEQELTSSASAEEKMECDNVELSLGLGPPEKALTQETLPSADATADQQQGRLKVPCDGAKSQLFWHQNFRVNLSNDSHQRMAAATWQAEALSQGAGKSFMPNGLPAAWSPLPGRFAVPVPKVSTIPAKRPYHEVSGERRPSPAVSEVAPLSTMQPSAGIYAWNYDAFHASSAGAAAGSWQQVHVNFEQAAASSHFNGNNAVNSAFGHSSRQLATALPSISNFKVPQAVPNSSMPPPSNALVNVKGGSSSSSQAADISVRPESENDNSRNKAPVVGWPPVRSFRKNTLQAAQISNRMSAEDLQPAKSTGGPSSSNTVDALEHMNGSSNNNAFFVKAKLDGVRICRKVDLRAYESYEGLKGALQEMFQGFVSDNAKLDLLNGNNYVVTHEDKDGDCLLVGDVPWHMFLESSVKSLRIMKSLDAHGIGEKGSAKVKAPENCKPS